LKEEPSAVRNRRGRTEKLTIKGGEYMKKGSGKVWKEDRGKKRDKQYKT